MKRTTLFLIFVLLCLVIAPSHAEFSRDRWYEMGLTALEDGTPQALEMAIDYFDAAGNYDQAKNYKQYCQYLSSIIGMEDGVVSDVNTIVAGLKRLGKKDDFEASLQEHGFYSCQLLVVYIEARQLEEKNETVKAWHAYYGIDDVLDAGERMDALAESVYKIGAVKLVCEDYLGAIEAFQDLDFANSEELLAQAMQKAYPVPTPAPVSVGDYVTFGHYEQDNLNNGKEPIEWLVLAKDGNHALLISRYNLDTHPYHDENASVTWETCSLRKWLNNDFLNDAFTQEEQQFILYTVVDNSRSQGSSKYNADGGNNTLDKIFVLSYAEALYYFPSDEARKSQSTDYTVDQGALIHDLATDRYWKQSIWWLRSPGYSQNEALYVHNDGSISFYGVKVSFFSVRPALWIDLNAGLY